MTIDQEPNQPNFIKIAAGTIISVCILSASLYIGYQYAQNSQNGIALPAGSTYLGPTPIPGNNQSANQPQPTPTLITAPTDTEWAPTSGKKYPYTFTYPSILKLVQFNDEADGVGIEWQNISPQSNVILSMEFIDKRNPELVKESKQEYVQNWYKFYPNLKGVKNVEAFTNRNGLKGYKAQYITQDDKTPYTDVFFEVPKQPELMIHMANSILDSSLFDQIVDGVNWKTLRSTPTPPEKSSKNI